MYYLVNDGALVPSTKLLFNKFSPSRFSSSIADIFLLSPLVCSANVQKVLFFNLIFGNFLFCVINYAI